MELEELKCKWDLLSARLDRQQIVRQQDMERMLGMRLGGYLRYVQCMLAFNIGCAPVVIAIAKFRGVPDEVIWWVMGIYLLCLLPSFYALRLLLRISRCDADIVEQERRMTRYAAFVRGYYIFLCVAVILFLSGLLLWAADYYTAHRMWWTVAGALSASGVVVAVALWYEWGRIGELRRRIRELREFVAD